MQMDNLALIASIEIAVALLVLSIFLISRNRSLKAIISKLQGRMTELVGGLKEAQNKQDNSTAVAQKYADFINEQIDFTKTHHQGLGSDRDIVLDFAPDTDLP